MPMTQRMNNGQEKVVVIKTAPSRPWYELDYPQCLMHRPATPKNKPKSDKK